MKNIRKTTIFWVISDDDDDQHDIFNQAWKTDTSTNFPVSQPIQIPPKQREIKTATGYLLYDTTVKALSEHVTLIYLKESMPSTMVLVEPIPGVAEM